VTEGFTPYPLPVTERTSGRAITALVLAIAAFVVCPLIPAVAALFVAATAAREIRESGGAVTGEGLVTASRIVAIANIVTSIVVIPILFAIAIPTFLGAQERAQDRAAQSNLRSAITAGKLFFVENMRYPGAAEIAQIEGGLTFVDAAVPQDDGSVAVRPNGPAAFFAIKSDSGTCFYVRDTLVNTEFATDENCGASEVQNFVAGDFPEG
jgi:type IV pilus assembly protein PilA